MAVAEIIGAAIGVLLLVVVAYILVGSTLTAAETVVNAQKDLTILNEARLKTDIRLNKDEVSITGKGLNFSVTNTGNEIVSDFDHVDVYTSDGSISEYQHYTYDKDKTGTVGTWTVIKIDNDSIHPNQLDPGEKAWIMAVFSGTDPIWVQFATNNGVYAQTTFP
jgi:archaeal flagellar protein FlaF